MIYKYFSGWNLQQWIYTSLGLIIFTQAFIEKEWLSLPFGIALIAMAIFKLGCAGGNCAYQPPPQKKELNEP